MTLPKPARTLPIRVPFRAGEAFDGWLEALARRSHITVHQLLPALGLPAPRKRLDLLACVPDHLRRRIETQSGLPTGRLDAALIDRFVPLGWIHTRGCRYCPHCLAERDSRWLLTWRLCWVFACTRRQILLDRRSRGAPSR